MEKERQSSSNPLNNHSRVPAYEVTTNIDSKNGLEYNFFGDFVLLFSLQQIAIPQLARIK